MAERDILTVVSLSHDERVGYEERILAAEMDVISISRRAATLRSLVRCPDSPGAYVGDTFYPVGGNVASHRWNGEQWEWLV